jgi:protein MPE1
MCSQTPVFRPGGKKTAPSNVPDHEPPTGYICYRCGEKGHWIQVCPTNEDPNFDNKPRVKRTTGIPRSFLKTVEKPVALSGDGTTDDVKPPSGVMVNAEGEFVIAEPDKASWEQFQAKTKSSAAAQRAAALGDKELQDRGLECSIDKRIFIDPMKTPCCEKTYCNDCITNALIESDFTCPGCQTDGVLIDDLKPDDETSTKIKRYLEEKSNAKKEKERSKSPSVKAETPPSIVQDKAKTKSPSPAPEPAPTTQETIQEKPKSPPKAEATIVNDEQKGKKRPADEVLENPKIPKGPKAMQQQEDQNQAMLKQQQNMMNSMPGFPNMPFDMSQQFFPNNGFGGMPNMNMMNNFGMGMGNPMMGMNQMMGVNGYGGFPNMNGMNMYGGVGGYGGMGPMGNNGMNGVMNGGGMNGGGMNGGLGRGTSGPATGTSSTTTGAGAAGGFSNQQKSVFSEPLLNEEDNAYFRKPVNPHRHQSRQRRARPSDYREL